MAQKRMFDKSITNSDNFLELPDSSQILYFHLSMNADDDGFVDNWKSIMRMIGTKEDDLKILIAKSYVIPFETGVIVIRHWRMNNYLRSDRYKETTHKLEKSQLILGENEEYVLTNKSIGIPMVDTDKNRIDKNSIDKNINIPSKVFEDEFDNLWKLYPKKIGKKDALRHYIRNRKNKVPYETILEGLKKYIEYINNTNTPMQFIKDGSTWFNQESWNDEREVEHKETEEEWLERMEKEVNKNDS